jgi:hypothetical protein
MISAMKLPVAARTRLAEIEDANDQAAQAYHTTSSRISELRRVLNNNPTGDHAEGYEFEISRMQGVHAQQREAMLSASNLARVVTDWLSRQPEGREFEEERSPSPKLRSGETSLQVIQRLRSEIANRIIERKRIAEAAPPITELKEQASEFVTELVARGRPTIKADAGTLAVSTDGKGFGPSSSIILAFAAWLDPEKFTARLHQEIDEMAKTCELRLTAQEKAEKLSKIAAEMRMLGMEEEAIIRHAASQGQLIARRFDVDAQIVLGVRRKPSDQTRAKRRVLIDGESAPT